MNNQAETAILVDYTGSAIIHDAQLSDSCAALGITKTPKVFKRFTSAASYTLLYGCGITGICRYELPGTKQQAY